ncbi:glycosyltransferase family 4 protein [Serinibacter salmoneus]|uniref:Glycosyltransferase involved in cell wall biosynthesis n=1 Tax=Serinibacter salmoneus TaxID=556530 RepID=A0A2A9CYM5_9MICO|nr:glycosyltransferase family 4 protein [Serinibacter salmoneus]PFG19537.1 glycosyltransferase involved in cell wall biosynthesis [Serinibacter salmoneus]
MRMLYLTEAAPSRDPQFSDGSAMIPYEVIRALPRHVEVTLVSFRGGAAVPPEIRERCAHVDEIDLPRSRPADLAGLLRGVYPADSRRGSARVRRMTQDLIRTHDATLVHGPHLAGALRGLPPTAAPVAFQTVDPWSLRTAMEAHLTSGPRAWYRRYSALVRHRLERALPAQVRLLTVGQADAESWSRALGRTVRAVPNGVDTAALTGPAPHVPPDAPPRGAPDVCFVGSLDYAPNVESARRLVHRVAPLLWEQRPDLSIVVAGRSPVPQVLELASDRVTVQANVPDLAALVRSARVAVFPDLHGLGKRNSVSEALAVGTPVVATAVAAREQGEHPLLTRAESDRDLAGAVLAAWERPPAAQPSQHGVAMRTWADAAADYLAALS